MKMIDHNKPIQQKKMPIREKKIKKLGTIKPHYVESTPFVWKDELVIFEWVRADSWAHNGNERGYYHIFNPEKNTCSKPFGYDHSFGSSYEENGVVYVHGVKGNDGWTNQIDMFWSSDLENWESKEAVIKVPEDMCVFNTSVCLTKNKPLQTANVTNKLKSDNIFISLN